MTKAERRKQDFDQEARGLREKSDRKIEEQIWDKCAIKQFVRRYGWIETIKNYLDQRQQKGVEHPWKYLTLPGANASDIGALYNENLFLRDKDGRLPVAICDMANGDKVFNNLENLGGILTYSTDHLHVALERKSGQGALYHFFPLDAPCNKDCVADSRRF